MLATCVNMVFTLQRYLHTRPTPPFSLGGEFLRREGHCFLRDAQTSLELSAEAGLFAEVGDGDQIAVTVDSVGGSGPPSVNVSAVTVVVRSRRERRIPEPLAGMGSHSAEFARFVQSVRTFFLQRGLIEVATPTLVTCPGLEPTLEPFPVLMGQDKTLYLPTSPEIHLKKALAGGWSDIFEIRPCFRARENSPHHTAEFTMLEWYRGFADLEMILEDLRALCATLTDVPLKVTTFRELFAEILSYDLRPDTTAEDLRTFCRSIELHHLPEEEFTDLFHRLLIDFIEPTMSAMGPLIVRDFPPAMAALARLTPEGWADRFEFYWNGLEIANAFNEVNDPREQERRWLFEQNERRRLGTVELPQDQELIEALESGMPPAGGIALGVERLYMAWRGVDQIGALKLFKF